MKRAFSFGGFILASGSFAVTAQQALNVNQEIIVIFCIIMSGLSLFLAIEQLKGGEKL